MAGLLVFASAGAHLDSGGRSLALAGRRHPGSAARAVGQPVYADVPLARAGPADAVASGLASDQPTLPRTASAIAPHARSGWSIRQRLCVSVDARAERALHRSRARALQRPRAGRGLRARNLAPRALRSPALPDRVGHFLRPRRLRDAGRRPGPGLAAPGALHAPLVHRLDRRVRVEARAPESPRDRERSPGARAVERRGSGDRRPHGAGHGPTAPPSLELRARTRRLAPEPGAAAAR